MLSWHERPLPIVRRALHIPPHLSGADRLLIVSVWPAILVIPMVAARHAQRARTRILLEPGLAPNARKANTKTQQARTSASSALLEQFHRPRALLFLNVFATQVLEAPAWVVRPARKANMTARIRMNASSADRAPTLLKKRRLHVSSVVQRRNPRLEVSLLRIVRVAQVSVVCLGVLVQNVCLDFSKPCRDPAPAQPVPHTVPRLVKAP